MATITIDYSALVKTLKRIVEDGEEQPSTFLFDNILRCYRIDKVKNMEIGLIDHFQTINSYYKRIDCIEVISRFKNIPIIEECNLIISSSLTEDEYIKKNLKKSNISNEYLKCRYKTCVEIISNSLYLTSKKESVEADKKDQQEKKKHYVKHYNLRSVSAYYGH